MTEPEIHAWIEQQLRDQPAESLLRFNVELKMSRLLYAKAINHCKRNGLSLNRFVSDLLHQHLQ